VRVTVERGDRGFAGGDRVMFLQNERDLGVKNGTLGTIEQVSAQSITVQTDDGRSVRFDLKDYNRIDHGYAATIHKAQGMTVDRIHVLATPGMDAHSSYVPCHDTAMAWSCITAATILRVGTGLSAPCRATVEGHGLGLRAARSGARLCRAARDHLRRARCRNCQEDRAGESSRHVRRPAAVCRRCAWPGRRAEAGAGSAGKEAAEDPEAALRKARTKALVRHARAVDAIFDIQEQAARPARRR